MNSKIRHVTAAVFDRAWFITPEHLRVIGELVRFHAEGGRLSADEIELRVEAATAAAGPRRGARTMGAVAVIPIYGVIMPRANLMTEYSGGATISGIRESFREALNDESVGSILLDVDSPGGYTDGVDELATEIRQSRGIKPIVAIADYCMASAAYYLASQADEVVASPSSIVGWIGTVMIHQEFSKMDELAGVTTTIIRQPVNKFGGNEYEPLSESARAEFQQRVDDGEAQFVNAVAKGRGVSAAKVRSDFGEGGGMTAARAKAAGLVDRVESFDETVRRLASGKGPASRGPGASAAAGDPYHVAASAPQEPEPESVEASIQAPDPDRTTEAEAALAIARAKIGR